MASIPQPDPVYRYKILDQLKLILIQRLEQVFSPLPEPDRLIIETPPSVSSYILNHPVGALIVLYNGSSFVESEIHSVYQARECEFVIVCVVRRRGTGRTPEEYVDFVIQALNGVTVPGSRHDRITCERDEFWGEENGVWMYGITFRVPSEFPLEALEKL